MGHNGETMFQTGCCDQDIHRTDGLTTRLECGAKSRRVCRRISGKGYYLHVLKQRAHLDAFFFSPIRRTTFDSVKQLVLGNGGDSEIGGTVPLRVADSDLMSPQKVDAGIGVKQMDHRRISLCSPWAGRLNGAGSESRILEKKPFGQLAGFMGETTQRSPRASIHISPSRG